MAFLYVISWILFAFISITFIGIAFFEFTKTPAQAELETLEDARRALKTGNVVVRTYWNPRMYALVALWVVSGTIVFW